MPYYNLSVGNEVLSEVASGRSDALERFGKSLGKKLTLSDQGNVAPYLLDEWTEGPHWVRPTIPVWESARE